MPPGGYSYGKSYPYSVLIQTDNLPPEVDPSKKELYLSDTDFQNQFKMERKVFETLAKWKQVNLKKAAGLF